jgi:hypothetical protein
VSDQQVDRDRESRRSVGDAAGTLVSTAHGRPGEWRCPDQRARDHCVGGQSIVKRELLAEDRCLVVNQPDAAVGVDELRLEPRRVDRPLSSGSCAAQKLRPSRPTHWPFADNIIHPTGGVRPHLQLEQAPAPRAIV